MTAPPARHRGGQGGCGECTGSEGGEGEGSGGGGEGGGSGVGGGGGNIPTALTHGCSMDMSNRFMSV